MGRTFRTILIYAIIFTIVVSMAWLFTGINDEDEPKEVEFSEFVTSVIDEKVVELSLVGTELTGTLKDGSQIHAYAPSSSDYYWLDENYIRPQIEEGKLVMLSEPPVTTPWYISILPYLLTIGLFVVFWIVFMSQSQGGGKAFNFSRSRAKLYKQENSKKVTYKDVAGLKEEKTELEEIVDFLKNPKRYAELGARIPKGVLLVGPPGTGKTYLSKATAGEAGVPFFSISGSDFVEMFVGVGASRVRDLFEQAKKSAPSIIFIDEIDAVGRRRGAGLGGGHDEREQTLNQMLVEMDGFGPNEGVIVFAATNRADILDPALLRPGRFDRRIYIGLPDIKGREEIFRVHSQNKPMSPSVDLAVLARRTAGFSPADIENILNEAALLTARRRGKEIAMPEIEEAITKVLMGPEKKSRVIGEDERKLTAYHEAGHAVAMRMLPSAKSPVHQITIIPRGGAGGFTMSLPEEEKSFETKTVMLDTIVHLLGGRVAEKLVLGDISTGASNDIERATAIAKNMVAKYGMSDVIGPVSYGESEEVFLGRDIASKHNCSEHMAAAIDGEVKHIVDQAYARCEKLLSEHLAQLKLVAETLLEIETMDGEQFEAIFTGQKTKEQVVAEVRNYTDAENKRIEQQKRKAAEEEALMKENEQDGASSGVNDPWRVNNASNFANDDSGRNTGKQPGSSRKTRRISGTGEDETDSSGSDDNQTGCVKAEKDEDFEARMKEIFGLEDKKESITFKKVSDDEKSEKSETNNEEKKKRD